MERLLWKEMTLPMAYRNDRARVEVIAALDAAVRFEITGLPPLRLRRETGWGREQR